MKRVFRYDRKKNTLVIQSIIMLVIAAIMFFQYSDSRKIVFLVLMAFALAFVAIYFYRIFVMRVLFSDDEVIFKGLGMPFVINKDEIGDIQLLKQVGREVKNVKYIVGGDYKAIGDKSYVLIRKKGTTFTTKLSMFNAATNDHIALEYVPGIEKYLDKLLESTEHNE